MQVDRTEVEVRMPGAPTLRGWLFVPKGVQRAPAISMCHGFAAVKEHGLEPFARAFAEAGFVVMVHDHRGFGASEGLPRHDIDPWVQVEDWRRALTFLERLPEVDADRIGVWGSSYSGGHALVMAATDPRVKCVVSQVPTISGFEQSRRRLSPDVAPSVVTSLMNDLRAQHNGALPQHQAVALLDMSTPAAYRAPEAVEFYLQDLGGAEWTNTVTVKSSFAARMYEPGAWISRIAPKPLLMIIATDDRVTLTDLELEAFEHAREPKRLVLVPGDHFAPYRREFRLASSAATTWFVEHLRASAN